jgi:hypothetical protein
LAATATDLGTTAALALATGLVVFDWGKTGIAGAATGLDAAFAGTDAAALAGNFAEATGLITEAFAA